MLLHDNLTEGPVYCAFSYSVLSVPLEEIITPGLTMRVAGEGMPVPGGGKVRSAGHDTPPGLA